jgi:hypothetical protein
VLAGADAENGVGDANHVLGAVAETNRPAGGRKEESAPPTPCAPRCRGQASSLKHGVNPRERSTKIHDSVWPPGIVDDDPAAVSIDAPVELLLASRSPARASGSTRSSQTRRIGPTVASRTNLILVMESFSSAGWRKLRNPASIDVRHIRTSVRTTQPSDTSARFCCCCQVVEPSKRGLRTRTVSMTMSRTTRATRDSAAHTTS